MVMYESMCLLFFINNWRCFKNRDFLGFVLLDPEVVCCCMKHKSGANKFEADMAKFAHFQPPAMHRVCTSGFKHTTPYSNTPTPPTLPTMSLVPRPLRSTDYKAYLPLVQEFRPTEFSQEQFETTLSEISKSGDVWVVEGEDGALIATATVLYEHKFIYNTCRVAHVEDVCVSAAYRNTGIGKQLLAHLVDEARKKQCYKISLDCANSVMGFYTSCGFYRDGNQMVQRFE